MSDEDWRCERRRHRWTLLVHDKVRAVWHYGCVDCPATTVVDGDGVPVEPRYDEDDEGEVEPAGQPG